jgi:HEAT repeat protein
LGDREAIHRAYDEATSAEEKRAAFQGFIALGDRDAIRDAYKNAKTLEERKAAIQGFIALGDSESIAKGIQTALDDDTKIALIHAYGALGGQPATTSTLLQLYNSESSPPVKKAVINALFVGGDAKELVALEHDPELHRSIVQQLSVMNDAAAKDYMLEILNR